MQFLSIVASALALAAMALPAMAADDRQLVKHASEKGTVFCQKWEDACKKYDAPKGSKFLSEVCQPGDYQGKHTKTEAKAYCSFTNSKGVKVLYTKQVAKELKATLV